MIQGNLPLDQVAQNLIQSGLGKILSFFNLRVYYCRRLKDEKKKRTEMETFCFITQPQRCVVEQSEKIEYFKINLESPKHLKVLLEVAKEEFFPLQYYLFQTVSILQLLFGVNNFFHVFCFVSAEAADVVLCPETLAVYPNKILLDCEAEVAPAVLNVPMIVSTMALEEFTAEKFLGKEVASKAGGLQAAEMLSKPSEFPDDEFPNALARLEIIVKKKLVALLLLLSMGKLYSPKLDVCSPPDPKESKG